MFSTHKGNSCGVQCCRQLFVLKLPLAVLLHCGEDGSYWYGTQIHRCPSVSCVSYTNSLVKSTSVFNTFIFNQESLTFSWQCTIARPTSPKQTCHIKYQPDSLSSIAVVLIAACSVGRVHNDSSPAGLHTLKAMSSHTVCHSASGLVHIYPWLRIDSTAKLDHIATIALCSFTERSPHGQLLWRLSRTTKPYNQLYSGNMCF